MVAFFVLGTAATRLGYGLKAARGIAQEKGGARGWRNAWANGGVPALLALLSGAAAARPGVGPPCCSPSPMPRRWPRRRRTPCSSEIGKAYGRRTFLITTLRPAVPGTEGAVSLEGTVAGLVGSAVVAAFGAGLGLYDGPLALVVALAGLLGSLAESVLGTVAERKGSIGNRPAQRLQHGGGGVDGDGDRLGGGKALEFLVVRRLPRLGGHLPLGSGEDLLQRLLLHSSSGASGAGGCTGIGCVLVVGAVSAAARTRPPRPARRGPRGR